ncbi:unnamed protein product, partial [Chrysoparadoxa australica]
VSVFIIPDRSGPSRSMVEGATTPWGYWMGIGFGDLNADGLLDIYIGNVGEDPDNGITNQLPLLQEEGGAYFDAYA